MVPVPDSDPPIPCDDPNPSAQWVRCRKDSGHDGWHESLGVQWANGQGPAVRKVTYYPPNVAAESEAEPVVDDDDGEGAAIDAFRHALGLDDMPSRTQIEAFWADVRAKVSRAFDLATPGLGLGDLTAGPRRPQTAPDAPDVRTHQPDPKNPPTAATAGRVGRSDGAGPYGGRAVDAGWHAVEIQTSDGPMMIPPESVTFHYRGQPDACGRDVVPDPSGAFRKLGRLRDIVSTLQRGVGAERRKPLLAEAGGLVHDLTNDMFGRLTADVGQWTDMGATDDGVTVTMEATTSELDRDLIDKVNAGAALVYALYHDRGMDGVGLDDVRSRWWKAAGPPLMDAYGRAMRAYDVDSRHRTRAAQDSNPGRCMQRMPHGGQCFRDHGHGGTHR